MYLASPMHGDDAGGSGKGSGSEGSSVDEGYGYIISDRRSGKKKAYQDYTDVDVERSYPLPESSPEPTPLPLHDLQTLQQLEQRVPRLLEEVARFGGIPAATNSSVVMGLVVLFSHGSCCALRTSHLYSHKIQGFKQQGYNMKDKRIVKFKSA
jgi:hypothetical protein